MKRSEFIEEAYRRADKAGKIDDEITIKFYLNMFEDMGMLPPELKGKGFYMKPSGEMVYEVYQWESEDD